MVVKNFKFVVGVISLFVAFNAIANDASMEFQQLTPLDQMNGNNMQQTLPPLNLPPVTSTNQPSNQVASTPDQIQQLQQMQQLHQMQLQQPANSMPATGIPASSFEQIPVTPSAPVSQFGSVNDPAFQNVLKKQFPLTPDQILRLREVMQDTQRATATPLQPPTPTVSTQTVSLSPGTMPPVIRLATGYVSSIVFVDETGSAWPIVGYSIGNPSAFNIQWDQKGNVLMMQGVGAYQTGNLAVQLQGLSMPVMVTIVNDQKIVDYRVDLRLQGRGPYANAPLMGNPVPAGAAPVLINLLDGVPPQGSEGLSIAGGDAQAWQYNNMIYLRTRLTVLSPAWNSTMTSPDGMKVYEMNTTPMILASDQGQTVTLKVEGL